MIKQKLFSAHEVINMINNYLRESSQLIIEEDLKREMKRLRKKFDHDKKIKRTINRNKKKS